jgi:hypothetical protein
MGRFRESDRISPENRKNLGVTKPGAPQLAVGKSISQPRMGAPQLAVGHFGKCFAHTTLNLYYQLRV